MTEQEWLLRTVIFLLRSEVDCLRSVLSEWDQDKSCYIQFIRAECLREAIEGYEHKLYQ